jgi:tetratricopeptide (TPR) repeat protein
VGHLRAIAASCAVALLTLARPAAAQPAPEQNFWDWLSDPNRAEIQVILQKVHEIEEQLPNRRAGSAPAIDPTTQPELDRLLRDAYGMLRYGLRLEPKHPLLLIEMAEVCDQLGMTDRAIAAARRYLAVELSDAADGHLLLGHLLTQRGDTDAAIVQFRLALHRPSRRMEHMTAAALGLASLYMTTGRLVEAIDLLEHQGGTGNRLFVDHDPLVRFALAVAYDRDSQISRAHEVIDQLGKNRDLIEMLVRRGRFNIRRVRYADPLDRHYFAALLYEVAGMHEEARAEWLTYAGAGPAARYRGRALEHVAEIDRLLAGKGTR